MNKTIQRKNIRGMAAIVLCFTLLCNCIHRGNTPPEETAEGFSPDTAFAQLYHQAWRVGLNPADNDIRSIAVDGAGTVWVATGGGMYKKALADVAWVRAVPAEEMGPSFSVVVDPDSSVWMSTWKGVYRHRGGETSIIPGVKPPAGELTATRDGVYAAGPHGLWLFTQGAWQAGTASIARSVRDLIPDGDNGLWVATDVGLYQVTPGGTRHLHDTAYTLSAYVKGLARNGRGQLWAGGLGGISILEDGKKTAVLRVEDGLPSNVVNTVRQGPDGVMWAGTDMGLVRFYPDGRHQLLFSRRWLINDVVRDIAFDNTGNAWVATAGGVSVIRKKMMTLESKQKYFQDVLMRRHIREPWIAGQCRLTVPGDTSRWEPEDDDNDGEYTGNYLAQESFRYATTQEPEARENAAKAFRFLKLLNDVTGTKGFFARTIVPAAWEGMHDGNRAWTDRELADALITEPRFKPVATRWHTSADGRWKWKGDTSSDEMCGHMFGYYFYYELVADPGEKERVGQHVAEIADHLLAHDFTLTDVDGTHTRWGVWSPTLLNNDPEWAPDRSLNSMEVLAVMKLAYHTTKQEKYQDAYLKLIRQHGFLENMSRIPAQNPAWFIYFDVMLQAYMYPILLKCEQDPELLSFYEQHIDAWFEKYRNDDNPLINFIYCYARDKRTNLRASVSFLKETPLDLVDWHIDHTLRQDVNVVRRPVMEDVQIAKVPPVSIRGTIRWDQNPYRARSGNPAVEREPVFWLLPYWMGRYLEMIGAPGS